MGRAGKIAAHVLLAFLAFLTGWVLAAFRPFNAHALIQAAIFAVAALLVELVLRVERTPWRFVAASDILRLARSALATALVFVVQTSIVSSKFEGVRALTCAFVIQVFLLSGIRVIRRGLHERGLFEAMLRLRPVAAHPALPHLLIIGRGRSRGIPARAHRPGRTLRPVGVVSPLEKETGDELRGVCVLGSIAAFDDVLSQLRDGGL
jgi:O-antigen biosynthesis protein WbqV